MEPRLTNNEKKMRNSMLQHEFPFDEQAWKAMQALLQQDERSPVPGPAISRMGTRLKKGKWVLLLFLLLFCVASGAVVWWGLSEFRSLPRRSEKAMSGVAGGVGKEKPDVRAHAVAKSLSLENKEHKPAIRGRSGMAYLGTYTRHQSSGSSTGRAFSGREERLPERFRIDSDKGHFDMQSENTGSIVKSNPESAGSDVLLPDDTAVEEPVPHFSEQVAALTPIETLALLPLSLTAADSLVRPVEDWRRPSARWQRAWVLGVGANTVDYMPLRVFPSPQVGQMLRYRVNPRMSLQGEVTLKFVSGYGLRAEFFDVVPTGSAQTILGVNNILFVEVPLTIHRQYAPGKAWLLGLKPAWTIPLLAYGQTNVFNSGAPRRLYTVRDGIRTFDLGLVLGWEWHFHPLWALDIRYNQGLFDLTVDGFFKNRAYHLNSDLQVSMRYFIVRN